MNLHAIQQSRAIAWRIFQHQYRDGYLGIAWYAIEPVVLLAVLVLLRDIVAGQIEYYALYVFTGLILFDLFRRVTIDCSKVFQRQAVLLRQLYVTPSVLINAVLMKNMYIYTIHFCVLVGLCVWVDAPIFDLFWHVLILPVFMLFAVGCGALCAVLGALLPDFRFLWRYLLRGLWFATPIFYSADFALPGNVDALNPLTYFIEPIRDVSIYQFPFDRFEVTIALLLAAIFALAGYYASHLLRGRIIDAVV